MACKICGRDRKIYSRGMCASCYTKEVKHEKDSGTFSDLRRCKKERQPQEKTLEIVELLKSGSMTQTEIAKKFGLTKQRIHSIKKKYVDKS